MWVTIGMIVTMALISGKDRVYPNFWITWCCANSLEANSGITRDTTHYEVMIKETTLEPAGNRIVCVIIMVGSVVIPPIFIATFAPLTTRVIPPSVQCFLFTFL